jgi:hypothetical protein
MPLFISAPSRAGKIEIKPKPLEIDPPVWRLQAQYKREKLPTGGLLTPVGSVMRNPI